MIYGGDYAEFTTVTDELRMVSEQLQLDFMWIRVRDGFRDDRKYREHSLQLTKTANKSGAILWAPYVYVNHRPTAPEADDQIQDAWKFATGQGRIHQMPIALDFEKTSSSPFPSNPYEYLDKVMLPACTTLEALQGRPGVVYCNPDMLLNYLVDWPNGSNRPRRSLLTLPKYAAIARCQLWLADWGGGMTQPYYWPAIKELGVWANWLGWQYKGSVSDWPGVSNIDLNRMQGTRAQLKAWALDPSQPVPSESITDPDPQDPPTDPQDPPTDPQPSAQLDRIEAKLNKVAAHFAD